MAVLGGAGRGRGRGRRCGLSGVGSRVSGGSWPALPAVSARAWPTTPASPLSGSSFLGPGTFPDSFPTTTPSTPSLPEFTPGPPPASYQPDIPSSLLTPEKSTPSLSGQVSAGPRGRRAVSRGARRDRVLLLPQMAPAAHLEPAHNPGPAALHTPNLGGPPGPQLHHPNPPPAARQPLGPGSGGPVGELAFHAAAGVVGPPMSGAGEAPEPSALDVSMVPLPPLGRGERPGAVPRGKELVEVPAEKPGTGSPQSLLP